jgi:hypothetical protein
MSQDLCARGRELFTRASQADALFKARLLEFFSVVRKDDREMKQIEILGKPIARPTRLFIGTKDSARRVLRRLLPCCGMQLRSDRLMKR